MNSGAYFAYGDLRERALKLSLESFKNSDLLTEDILSRASKFYDFLAFTGEDKI